MTESWENMFIEKQTIWGFEPAESAIRTNDFFLKQNVKDILMPGIGYGRNASLFQDNGIKVTGIEISKTAIELARTHYGTETKIYHGSVTAMPFDDKLYDGVFCYGLVYLLNSEERKKFISDCYKQLRPDGYMVFAAISTTSPNYGMGKQLGKDYFEIMSGVNLFFYSAESVKQEFGGLRLVDFYEIDEPVKNLNGKTPFKFWLITCQKSGSGKD